VFSEKIDISFPINAETPSSVSPAVTKGKVPGTLSALLRRLPLVDFPNSFSRLTPPIYTFKVL
jgi:hypothetical protein